MGSLLDEALERAFGRAGEPIRFIQIGGNDGVFQDPLYKHHQEGRYAFGWGQVYEPLPEYFALLVENMKPFPYVTCHPAAVDASDEPGQREFSYVSPQDIESRGLPGSSRGIGSFSRDRNALGGVRYSEAKFLAIKDHIRTTVVDTVPVREVTSKYSDANLLVTDCEGHDVEIISGAFNDPNFRPRVVQFEYLGFLDDLYKSTVHQLKGLGYEISRGGKDTLCELRQTPAAAQQ